MNYTIKDRSTLKILLWIDTFLGGTTAIIGLSFFEKLSTILGLTIPIIVIISMITFLYAVVAFILATQKSVTIPLLKILVSANWIWTFISSILLLIYYGNATVLGVAFLILQVLVVGGLAYSEANQILKNNTTYH